MKARALGEYDGRSIPSRSIMPRWGNGTAAKKIVVDAA